MRKIFIDLGCGNCDDLINFWENNKDYIYYGVDASNNYKNKWVEIKEMIPGIQFINKSVWTKEGHDTFYEERNDNPQGSTMIEEKKGTGSMFAIKVETFDFSKWLEQFKNDYVVVFMDIEGSEYCVLDKLINDSNISIIKKLFLETHVHKIDNNEIKALASKVGKELKELKIRFVTLGGNSIVKNEYYGEKMRIIKPKIEHVFAFPNRGKHCFIAKIEGNTYRVFDVIDAEELTEEWMDKNFHWGDYPTENKPYHGWSGLKEATIIQNICWYHGLAPRVYEIVGVELDGHKYFAQRIEDISKESFGDQEHADDIYHKVLELGKTYGFHTEKEDVSKKDVLGDKLVDFNTLHFTDDHREKTMAIVRDKGHYGKSVYQSEPKLDIISTPRKTDHRIEAMKLDQIDFKGKSFLDLGCATGAFVRYAKDRGAESVLGIDYEDVIGTDTRLAAYLISWELGYFDVEFKAHDLREYKPEPADIVFFLSMAFHIGIPDWLGEVTKEVLIFEENSRNFKDGQFYLHWPKRPYWQRHSGFKC